MFAGGAGGGRLKDGLGSIPVSAVMVNSSLASLLVVGEVVIWHWRYQNTHALEEECEIGLFSDPSTVQPGMPSYPQETEAQRNACHMKPLALCHNAGMASSAI